MAPPPHLPGEIMEMIASHSVDPCHIDRRHPDHPQPRYCGGPASALMEVRTVSRAFDAGASTALFRNVRVVVRDLDGLTSLRRLDAISTSRLCRHVQSVSIYVATDLRSRFESMTARGLPVDPTTDDSAAWDTLRTELRTTLPAAMARFGNLTDLSITFYRTRCLHLEPEWFFPGSFRLFTQLFLLPHPGLISLSINTHDCRLWNALKVAADVQLHATRSDVLFPHLQSLSVENCLDFLAVAGRLGNIQTLLVSSFRFGLWHSVPNMQNITRLHLSRGRPPAANLVRVLERLPKLRHIKVHDIQLFAGVWALIFEACLKLPELIAFIPLDCGYFEHGPSRHHRDTNVEPRILTQFRLFNTRSREDHDGWIKLSGEVKVRRAAIGLPPLLFPRDRSQNDPDA